ncbi:RNA polymerase sigma-70 factor [Pedobacter metabolipauper]|uniref:RNA polymerase sigma-70 factor (ECF subfamily) n=1 Tax=Pedobacter metabolipauper TaxID=425513 RepID=A0A4R6SV58_9SPHI|nr:RNA polymerase sigma-70 factor [Pedobacter metabolipauper]TDQ09660.1 RNA polymerase sigma-70 factor (ECF subfamily) [Pedobacter metabolipauper]
MQAKQVSLWTDEQLIDLLKQDDEAAFQRIYRKYVSKLYASAYNLLRDPVACEEIVQELFIQLWIKRHELEIKNLNSYLYMATRNRVLMGLRTKKIALDNDALEFLESNYSSDSLIREKQLNREIDNAILSLPEKCREIFILSRKQQLSNREIAELMNISVKTVENQITRALQKLRHSLKYYLLVIAICPWMIKYFF